MIVWFPKLWKLQHVGITNDQLCLSIQCMDSLVKNRDIGRTDFFARPSELGRGLVSIVTIYSHIFLICRRNRTLILSSDTSRVKEKTNFKSLGFKESDCCWTYKCKNKAGVRGWLGTENLRSCVYGLFWWSFGPYSVLGKVLSFLFFFSWQGRCRLVMNAAVPLSWAAAWCQQEKCSCPL